MEDNNENWLSELDISGLNLIDEDDNLLFHEFSESDADKDEKGLSLFGDTNNGDEERNEEQVLQSQKNFKSNLRKSLAWDKAFFTNPGVLEPDELSSMIESNHMGEKKSLLTIQEDVNRSTESISTFQSDCTVETSLDQECVFFEDVRAASIQRSALSSDAATPEKSKEFGAAEASPSPTPSTLDDPRSQEKMKPNVVRKRPSIRAQGLGKVTKQHVAAKEHTTSISKPTYGLNKSVRASVDIDKTKQEKKLKLTGGKEPLATRVPISRRTGPIVSKPVVPFKSASRSLVASKNELTSSCSSLESCISAVSTASKKSSLDSVKQKKAQNLRAAAHSLGNGSTSRAASKNIGQPKVSTLSATRTYKSKLSSNSSSFSASVDWSSASPRASTPSKMAKDDLNLAKQGAKRGSVVNGGAVPSASMMKPTGLRVPSPKIGYFDAARNSVARTPTGSSASLVSGMANHRARSPNEPTASRTKSGKSQTKRSPLIQEYTNPKAKASSVSRSPKLTVSASASSPKLTNKMYSKVSAEEQLKANEAEDNVVR